MTGLLRTRTFLRKAEVRPHYDVVIVGGGVNGLALAYNLAAGHGVRNVAVFERAYIGSGGSGRNTQVVRANYNTPETVPLYKASLEIWRTLSAELDFNVMFSTQGELDLVHTFDALEVERDKALLNNAYGVANEILTPEEVVEAVSAGGSDRWRRAPDRRRLLPSTRILRAPRLGGVGLRDRRAGARRGRARGRRGHRPGRARRRVPRRPHRRRSRRRGSRGERRGGLQLDPRVDGGPPPAHQHPPAAGLRDRAVRARAGRPGQLDGPLRLHLADRARRAPRGRGDPAVQHVLDPLHVRLPRGVGEALDPDPPVHGQGASDASVGRPLRHDAGLLPAARGVRGAELLPDGRDGDLGVQGLPHLRRSSRRS